MLISYPILPDHLTGASAPEPDLAPHGFYPISRRNRWHGGVHLDPGASADRPVLAIADGKLIAYRQASQPEYKSYDQNKTQPSDTSFVLLKHSTETGNGVRVEFYSLYMHLRNVADFPPSFVDRAHAHYAKPLQSPEWDKVKVFAEHDAPTVYRKEVVGLIGQWGGKHYVHFETFCTQDQLNAFFPDCKVKYQEANRNGDDEYWGDAYFMIPASTKFHSTYTQRVATQQRHYNVPPLQSGQNAQRLYVRVRYERGTRYTQTWSWNDQTGAATPLGGEQAEREYEYGLYQKAADLYDSCPSAGFDLLRTGRNLGPDRMRLSSDQNVAWAAIPYSGTETGYVNLADAAVLKFSDADFPHFMHWRKINEDGKYIADDGHGVVDVLADVVSAVDTNADGKLTGEEYEAWFRSDPTARERMRRLVVQHSSEWDKRTQVTRYQDLTQQGEVFDKNPVNFQAFLDFYAKAAFWEEAGLPEKVWYFHPIEIISHFRKCGWLSQSELAQLLPRKSGLPHPTQTLSWQAASSRVGGTPVSHTDIGSMFRRYGLTTPERQTGFLSQTYIETGLLRVTKELGEGAGHAYEAFYGRGLMQLTWPTLYADYGSFRKFPNHTGAYVDSRITVTSTHNWSGPPTVDQHGHAHSDTRLWAPRYDPDVVATNSFDACDSAGFFWVWKHFMGQANIHRIADEGITTESVGRMSILVNGGGNGYNERQQYAAFVSRYLSDSTERTSSGTLTVARQRIVTHPHQTPMWGQSATTTPVMVDYSAQRP
ncbi:MULTISPECIES: hypothetical protein [Paraburkholderia]|uniref:EF-hand domain-containing protein n=1 Tax=Paraburkholderia largidicola TaxID=3014751 RepID=A0A7I8BVG0_9BURK|nr:MULTISPECIES: hypothetical protein [Paraburkholderia]BCF92796.1 hypothetical protein PPGU16_58630 [Paraburkholderia sp. PGU16]BEU25966.1 M23 family metallopeptidase [Paraburkholderia sp. 22B1P]GJH33299.1 hypothetical protein CBA19CS91_11100 [Paraburkholderia hospita]CAG9259373.1 putative Peptidase M23 [Paraburkholderia caribensis]